MGLDWDGTEREYLVCFDSYRYNVSVGSDPRSLIFGFDRVRRISEICQASTIGREHPRAESLTIGDQVDCWRPRKDLSNMPVDMRSCGQPYCTLVHVYSCSTTDCVQLITPAEQFDSVFCEEAVFLSIGRYILVSGVILWLVMVGMQIFCASRAFVFVTLGAPALAAGMFALILLELLLTEHALEKFAEGIVPNTFVYFAELMAIGVIIGSYSVLKDDEYVIKNFYAQFVSCSVFVSILYVFY